MNWNCWYSYKSSSVCTNKGDMVSLHIMLLVPMPILFYFSQSEGQLVGIPPLSLLSVCFVFMNWKAVPAEKDYSVLKSFWSFRKCFKQVFRELLIFCWQLIFFCFVLFFWHIQLNLYDLVIVIFFSYVPKAGPWS